ncbi:hypothetical protein TraAM80_05293 [Trypanosoma rangeli]|uniref:Uncharacterized protein n=1 Tax=Trypanosoma rangeli TaxID=5698 RepID=A0A3R7ME80_TRYRA|nr:uncharacterized protein TraAM80_05293 [Trypanosoma rangeli]RNF04188.1 hypothetical protein TraAM80_05293 [Trypanosoma rangeli]|eukprot:RNF04188.1 hypothetical protein TraAM80_05293 [Trypanosoma rangeli]
MAPCGGNAVTGPESVAARRLDFYLPPPDHRAYRRGKIQLLRDHITAWRHQPRCGVGQAFSRGASASGKLGGVVADPPLWNAANVVPPHRNVSRHEKVLLLSQVSQMPRSGRRTPSTAPHGDSHERPLRLTGYANTLNNNNSHAGPILGRVTEVPYFHDQAVFCLPRDTRVAAATASTFTAAAAPPGALDDNGAPQTEPSVLFCYGVTSNTEEMSQCREQANPTERAVNGEATPLVKSTISSSSFKSPSSFSFSLLKLHDFRAASGLDSAKHNSLKVDSSFAARTQCVELAMAVHAERTRRTSSMQRMRSEGAHQRVLERTMEIPIDWREFERLCPGSRTFPPTTLSEKRSSTPSLGHTRLTAASATGAEGRGPMRLYNICIKRRVANMEGSMESASTFPRLGTRVVLSKSWV